VICNLSAFGCFLISKIFPITIPSKLKIFFHNFNRMAAKKKAKKAAPKKKAAAKKKKK
jgi:hypothetical protein